mgnify:CR=1 FL=1
MALKNIFLTGHLGMVGSAVYKHLLNESSSKIRLFYKNLIHNNNDH